MKPNSRRLCTSWPTGRSETRALFAHRPPEPCPPRGARPEISRGQRPPDGPPNWIPPRQGRRCFRPQRLAKDSDLPGAMPTSIVVSRAVARCMKKRFVAHLAATRRMKKRFVAHPAAARCMKRRFVAHPAATRCMKKRFVAHPAAARCMKKRFVAHPAAARCMKKRFVAHPATARCMKMRIFANMAAARHVETGMVAPILATKCATMTHLGGCAPSRRPRPSQYAVLQEASLAAHCHPPLRTTSNPA